MLNNAEESNAKNEMDTYGNVIKDFKLPDYDGSQGTKFDDLFGQYNKELQASKPVGVRGSIVSADKESSVNVTNFMSEINRMPGGGNTSTLNLDALLDKQDKRLERIENLNL